MTSMELNQSQMVAGVRFTKVGKLYHFDYSDYPELQPGDYVIVETARGRNMGQVMGFTEADPSNQDYKPILRPASPRDLLLRQHWEEQQAEALGMEPAERVEFISLSERSIFGGGLE